MKLWKIRTDDAADGYLNNVPTNRFLKEIAVLRNFIAMVHRDCKYKKTCKHLTKKAERFLN